MKNRKREGADTQKSPGAAFPGVCLPALLMALMGLALGSTVNTACITNCQSRAGTRRNEDTCDSIENEPTIEFVADQADMFGRFISPRLMPSRGYG
ncbi:MAG: hypothetical protein ACLFNQ_00285 [Spirochaetaceae bacterium]